LASTGDYTPPTLSAVEEVLEMCIQKYAGMGDRRPRVLVDTWDLGRFAKCASCASERVERLGRMNLGQMVLPGVGCGECGQ
jgi:archaeosine synthase beta-subunit